MLIAARLRNRLRARFSRFVGDRRGVAAVEFAFIVPVLLCMYFLTMEASQGIEVNKKVSRIGSMVADLVAQSDKTIKEADVLAIMKIGQSIIRPYNRSVPEVEITAIRFDDKPTPKARVVWSLKLGSDGKPTTVADVGSEVTDPQLIKIRAANAFYIRVTSKLAYEPVITWSPEAASVGLLSTFSGIKMGETYYLRPRITNEVLCTDCPDVVS